MRSSRRNAGTGRLPPALLRGQAGHHFSCERPARLAAMHVASWRRLSLGSSGGVCSYSNSGKSLSQRFSPSVARRCCGPPACHSPSRSTHWSAGDHVAAGVEARTAGLQREAVDVDRALFFQAQTGSLAEIQIEGFAHGEDDGVALEALNLVGRDRLAAARLVVFAEAGLYDLDRLDVALRRRR